jgi:hypothetical protein
MTLPDKSSLSGDYGGPYTDGRPVEDPTTEVGAAPLNAALNDAAMLTHTAPRAWVLFTGKTYTSGTVSVTPDDHDALWGSGTGVRPTIGETSAGVFVITWATTQTDELGVSHTLNIRVPVPLALGSVTALATPASWTANTITLNTYSSGIANALNGIKIFVAWF